MSYIDGFVIPAPTADRQGFIDHAERLDRYFLQHGATRVLECWGVDVPDGTQTDFKRAVQATPEEAVAFSWIEWPDKATRDAGMKALEPMAGEPMPFDGKRMIFGGFQAILDLGSGGPAGYVQGFVVPVPEGRREDYRKLADEVDSMFVEFGCTRIVEAWGDDVPHGAVTDFYRSVDAQDGEAVVFAFAEWPSKEACDAAAARMQNDERMKAPPPDMPFDGRRMIYGGFTPVVQLGG